MARSTSHVFSSFSNIEFYYTYFLINLLCYFSVLRPPPSPISKVKQHHSISAFSPSFASSFQFPFFRMRIHVNYTYFVCASCSAVSRLSAIRASLARCRRASTFHFSLDINLFVFNQQYFFQWRQEIINVALGRWKQVLPRRTSSSELEMG